MTGMILEAVRDAGGIVRHVPRPAPAPTTRGGKTKAKVTPDPMQAQDVGNVSADQLRLLLERIERLEEEKAGIANDIADVYGEAKGTGFDVKTMKAIIRLRRMEKHHRDEADMLLDTYKTAIGL